MPSGVGTFYRPLHVATSMAVRTRLAHHAVAPIRLHPTQLLTGPHAHPVKRDWELGVRAPFDFLQMHDKQLKCTECRGFKNTIPPPTQSGARPDPT